MEKQQDRFDIKVSHRDSKSGAVTHTNPYVLTVLQTDAGRLSLFERPPGSGNLFDKKGHPCGRWKTDEKGKKVHDPEAVHTAYQKPETNDQKLSRQMLEVAQENERLKKALAAKEVESIKAEAKSKDGVGKKV